MFKRKVDKAKVAPISLPKVGSKIYVESSYYIDHGEDDVTGGLATVKTVTRQKDGNHSISVKEIFGEFYWEAHLAPLQAELKKEFGKNRAHPSPDTN